MQADVWAGSQKGSHRTLLAKNYLDQQLGQQALEVLQQAVTMKSDDFLVLHYLGEGFDGLRFSLLGMIAATALTVPLYMLKRVTRTEFAISCAFGGILGFVGSSIAFLIAYMLLAIQHFLEADSVFVSDHIIPVSMTSGAEFLTKDEKSALAEIEARKILRSDSKQFKNLNFENKNTDDVPSHKRGHRHVDILPWRVKLALAALTILMFGVP